MSVFSYSDDPLSPPLYTKFVCVCVGETKFNSDSLALSVGITNGDLFTHVIAFSPGFMAPGTQVGRVRLFISHGKNDKVLPIEHCSRVILPQLQQAGYEVLYHPFNGSHTVPEVIVRKALDWFTASCPTES